MDELIEQVESFQYLGIDYFGSKRKTRYWVKQQNRKGKQSIMRWISVSNKDDRYRPILTYTCETFVLSEKDKSKIKAREIPTES